MKDFVYNTGSNRTGEEVFENIKASYYTTDYGVLTFVVVSQGAGLLEIKKTEILSLAPGQWASVFPEEE